MESVQLSDFCAVPVKVSLALDSVFFHISVKNRSTWFTSFYFYYYCEVLLD